jgi:hypothetical protein
LISFAPAAVLERKHLDWMFRAIGAIDQYVLTRMSRIKRNRDFFHSERSASAAAARLWFMSAAAIASGLCETVLIAHGERGRSGVGRTRNVVAPTSLAGQFEQPYGPMAPPTLFTIPVLRYMKTVRAARRDPGDGLVAQREWAAKNPRATFKRRSPSGTCSIRG